MSGAVSGREGRVGLGALLRSMAVLAGLAWMV